ncbi:MAG: ribonuclease P protein component [Dysgonamonadaceae bacterium]|jgi:ribonuclease P protein component|nr:ribonuclease P protein component [Dysgonamonadaceae bacterium]MDD3355566.1 ribonuclease P protein component [Dysgonamonadaceae bacterium]MDD3727911.1 ribonuclease P protein component [Dysgonamonadaceae bacterium]MDD4245854.1 ribonuclease P protein component [Dysgonamonadaceae bacterium]MDD4606179.1 ribonuclease P protein component [Dysgonamonadaceae bacterium]
MKETGKQFTFSKNERITGTKRIDALFIHGKGFICYPLRIIYLLQEQKNEAGCSVLISVPKKRIKKATQRNRIKRLIRESYRLNKKLIDNTELGERSLKIAFIYVKENESDLPEIQKAMQKALIKITEQIKKREESE